jgi:hypothetical protein
LGRGINTEGGAERKKRDKGKGTLGAPTEDGRSFYQPLYIIIPPYTHTRFSHDVEKIRGGGEGADAQPPPPFPKKTDKDLHSGGKVS